jgi:hypothetical protein
MEGIPRYHRGERRGEVGKEERRKESEERWRGWRRKEVRERKPLRRRRRSR